MMAVGQAATELCTLPVFVFPGGPVTLPIQNDFDQAQEKQKFSY
jgi:hypothetical protein